MYFVLIWHSIAARGLWSFRLHSSAGQRPCVCQCSVNRLRWQSLTEHRSALQWQALQPLLAEGYRSLIPSNQVLQCNKAGVIEERGTKAEMKIIRVLAVTSIHILVVDLHLGACKILFLAASVMNFLKTSADERVVEPSSFETHLSPQRGMSFWWNQSICTKKDSCSHVGKSSETCNNSCGTLNNSIRWRHCSILYILIHDTEFTIFVPILNLYLSHTLRHFMLFCRCLASH